MLTPRAVIFKKVSVIQVRNSYTRLVRSAALGGQAVRRLGSRNSWDFRLSATEAGAFIFLIFNRLLSRLNFQPLLVVGRLSGDSKIFEERKTLYRMPLVNRLPLLGGRFIPFFNIKTNHLS